MKSKSGLSIISPPARVASSSDHLDIVVVQVLLETPDRTWIYPDPATSSVQGGSKETGRRIAKDEKTNLYGLLKSSGASDLQGEGGDGPPSQATKLPGQTKVSVAKMQNEGNEAVIDRSAKSLGQEAVNPANLILPIQNSPAKKVNWLEDWDMLHEAIPEARISRFGFRPSIAQNTNMDFERLGQELLDSLRDMRIVHPEWPLIFIGHGFGGIVVQCTILEAVKQNADDFIKSISGLVFLGTPFLGSEHAANTIRNRLSQLARTAVSPSSLQDTHHLAPTLVSINKGFNNIIQKTRKGIICIVEKRKTKVRSTALTEVRRHT